MGAIQKLVTLDFASLKGWRTAIGLVTYLGDSLAGSALCVSHPGLCVALKGISAWFLAMGIRAK